MNNINPRAFFGACLLFACFALAACPPPISDDISYGEETADEGPPGLDGTAWTWSGVKLSFTETSAKVAGQSQAHPYSYDRTERSGSVTDIGNFTVDEDFLKLHFDDFKGMGNRSFDNQNAALVGTKWRFGHAVLEFRGAKARLHGIDYGYNYNLTAKTGALTAAYGSPGPFTLSTDETELTFTNYRECRYQGSAIPVVFAKITPDTQLPPASSLIGSDWWWTGTSLHLDFITDSVVLLWSVSGYYVPALLFDYNWNPAARTGRVHTGRNDVGPKYDLGDFSINGDLLNFVQYGPYPHGAAFYLQE